MATALDGLGVNPQLAQILMLLSALGSQGGAQNASRGPSGQPLPNAAPAFGSPTGGAGATPGGVSQMNIPAPPSPQQQSGGQNQGVNTLPLALALMKQNPGGNQGQGGGKGGPLGKSAGGVPGGSGSLANLFSGGSGSLTGGDVSALSNMFGPGLGAGVSPY